MPSSNCSSRLRQFLGALALLTLTVPALAQPVRYDFTALSSFENSGETFTGSFSVLSASGFVTSPTTFQVADLLSCEVVPSPAASASCRKQEFLFNVSPGSVTVSFGVQTDTNPGTGIYYYFDENAFSTPGMHASTLFGSQQAGTLLVTAVPEPGSAALLALGLAVVGVAGARMRNRTAAVPA